MTLQLKSDSSPSSKQVASDSKAFLKHVLFNLSLLGQVVSWHPIKPKSIMHAGLRAVRKSKIIIPVDLDERLISKLSLIGKNVWACLILAVNLHSSRRLTK